jgi:hypothetical protein
VKTKVKGWSVQQQETLERIKDGMPAEQKKAIEEQANDQGIADVFGADWKQHVDSNGNPTEGGVGSVRWLVNATEQQCERHFSAIGRFIGPAAERAEREKIARLRGAKAR